MGYRITVDKPKINLPLPEYVYDAFGRLAYESMVKFYADEKNRNARAEWAKKKEAVNDG